MSDKRKVSTDALEVLGTIIDNTVGRDAIHLAVEPIEAGEKIYPGQDIGIIDGKAYLSNGYTSNIKPLGIADPFIKGVIQEGQRFLLVVYPRTITSLRHVWEHPDFNNIVDNPIKVTEELTQASKSELWIRNFAATVGLKYDIIMDGAADYVESKKRDGYGEYLCFGRLLEGEDVPNEFWEHYEIVTGIKVADEHRGSFFTCSC